MKCVGRCARCGKTLRSDELVRIKLINTFRDPKYQDKVQVTVYTLCENCASDIFAALQPIARYTAREVME